jgi:hypothetical protein
LASVPFHLLAVQLATTYCRCDSDGTCTTVCKRGSVVVERWLAFAIETEVRILAFAIAESLFPGFHFVWIGTSWSSPPGACRPAHGALLKRADMLCVCALALWQLQLAGRLPLCLAQYRGTHNSGITLADGYGNLDPYFERYFKWIKWAVRLVTIRTGRDLSMRGIRAAVPLELFGLRRQNFPGLSLSCTGPSIRSLSCGRGSITYREATVRFPKACSLGLVEALVISGSWRTGKCHGSRHRQGVGH